MSKKKKETIDEAFNETDETEKTYNLSVFKTGQPLDDKKFKIISSPTIVPLSQMKVGEFIEGEIVSLQESRKKSIKSGILVIKIESGQNIGIPMHACIANVILDSDQQLPENFVGETIRITKTGEKVSESYKKKYNVYEVAITGQE